MAPRGSGCKLLVTLNDSNPFHDLFESFRNKRRLWELILCSLRQWNFDPNLSLKSVQSDFASVHS